jgi:hypothetical protein
VTKNRESTPHPPLSVQQFLKNSHTITKTFINFHTARLRNSCTEWTQVLQFEVHIFFKSILCDFYALLMLTCKIRLYLVNTKHN